MDCRVARRLNSTLCLLVLISSTAGCSLFGNNKLAQYAADNERLISDYRAERDRAAQLELQNRALTGRIAALEGRLAAIADAVQEPEFRPASSGRQTPAPADPSATSQPTPRIPAAPAEPASSDWRRSGL
ncbi:hypothetical protein SH139x_000783 [Planctomycetaceae bacterium SH139]